MLSSANRGSTRSTLAAVFAEPVRSFIRWRDVEPLLESLGALRWNPAEVQRVHISLNAGSTPAFTGRIPAPIQTECCHQIDSPVSRGSGDEPMTMQATFTTAPAQGWHNGRAEYDAGVDDLFRRRTGWESVA